MQEKLTVTGMSQGLEEFSSKMTGILDGVHKVCRDLECWLVH